MLQNRKSMQYKVDLLLIRKECHHQSVRLTGAPGEVSVHAYLSNSVITSFNKSEKPIESLELRYCMHDSRNNSNFRNS